MCWLVNGGSLKIVSCQRGTHNCDADTLPETRVWGSKEKTPPCCSATAPLRIELHWGCGKSSWENALGSAFTYDGEGRAVTASGGLGSGTYTYDGNGLRVEKVAGSTTTVYIFSGSKVIAEYAGGAAPSSPTREYIYAGGALLARIDSSGTNYYHQDHLSNRMVTNSSGSVVAEMGHFPFGESWYNTTNDKLYFTTYEYDSESGNHYAMARYHVSRLGRLSSPDPIAGSTADPQSLNRYSYSINDPANVTDPSGASTGCNTAEKQPTDKSQQASGGGPSEPDDSDTDTEGGDADADPPPQSGCVSHVNPFGSGSDGVGLDGSDITDLSGGLSGLLGSGAWVGNVTTTGVNTGSGLVPQVVEYNQQWSTWTNGPRGPSTTSGSDQQWAVLWLPAVGGLLTPSDSGPGGNGPGNHNPQRTSTMGPLQPQPNIPWYKNPCILGALGKGAFSAGIDAIGLIPEAGGIARIIGHQAGYVGVVADKVGSNIVKAVEHSTGTTQGLAGLSDTSPAGLASTGLTVAGFIPGAGQIVSIASIGVDIAKTAKAIGKCH